MRGKVIETLAVKTEEGDIIPTPVVSNGNRLTGWIEWQRIRN